MFTYNAPQKAEKCQYRKPEKIQFRRPVDSPLDQCFSTVGQRPSTGSDHQLYRAARDSPGIDN